MFTVLSTEFLKLRRSKMLFLAAIASLLPAVVRYLQYVLGKSRHTNGWEWFLASNQELVVMCMIISVVLVASFVFSMEYQYKTVSYIFTSNVSKTRVFISKMISLLSIIIVLVIISALSSLLWGYLALGEGAPKALLAEFARVFVWDILSYSLLSTIVVMLAAITKRFVVSAVIALGYIVLVFPFHLKGNPYICPFMTPTVIAAKIFNSNDYIFSNYYTDISISSSSAAAFLAVLAIASLIIGIIRYKRSDVL